MTDLWIVEDGKLILYRRLGSCNACGECCCSDVMKAQIQVESQETTDVDRDQTDEDFSQYEGFSVFFSQGFWWWMKMDTEMSPRTKACLSFVDGKCAVWEKRAWPALCRYWPIHPANLEQFPNCGFSFERLEI